MIEKEINSISWNVDEPTYRGDTAISYSMLSTYAKAGIKGLKNALEGVKITSGSLRHGSAVDTLLTDEANFHNLYLVANYLRPSDSIRLIMDNIYNETKANEIEPMTLAALSEQYPDFLTKKIEENKYGGDNWKPETKIRKLVESGEEYYNLLVMQGTDKQLIHKDDYELALACKNEIINNDYTGWLFQEHPHKKLYFQLKFKIQCQLQALDDGSWVNTSPDPMAWQDGLTVETDMIRCMLDMVHVDYKNKIIIPIDLKTTYDSEEEFGKKAFFDWHYDLQSTMYHYILRTVCASDPYFKDFTVSPFCFLPINKHSLNPQFFMHKESIEHNQRAFRDYKGTLHLPWYVLLDNVRWHIENKNFRYYRSTVRNEGTTIIDINYDR